MLYKYLYRVMRMLSSPSCILGSKYVYRIVSCEFNAWDYSLLSPCSLSHIITGKMRV